MEFLSTSFGPFLGRPCGLGDDVERPHVHGTFPCSQDNIENQCSGLKKSCCIGVGR